jgi:transcriptional regulator with XRE-family HTH domain
MKKSILKKFGKMIRNKRIELGLSQEELGWRSGLHRTYIGMIERGEKNITLLNIEKLCNGLSIKISDIFRDFKS